MRCHLAVILFGLFALSPTLYGSPFASMDGCYQVDYRFQEIESLMPGYEVNPEVYHAQATELVVHRQIDENRISLQHILQIPGGFIKHFREEWQKNPEFVHAYVGNRTWQRFEVPREDGNQAGNLWAQSLLQIDDSPRYGCAGLLEGRPNGAFTWTCQTTAPLPRREYSHRSDYQILDRQNRISFEQGNLSHEQDNIKMRLIGEVMEPLAREQGLITYHRIADERCSDAKAWWQPKAHVWHIIQKMWTHVYEAHSLITIREKVDGIPLWQHLNQLAERYIKLGDLNEEQENALLHETHEAMHRWIVH